MSDNVIWGVDFSRKMDVPPEFAHASDELVQTAPLAHTPKIEHWSTREFWHGPFEPEDGAA